MAAGHRLDAVEPAIPRAARRLAEVAHDARDIVAIDLMGEVAVIVFTGMRRAERPPWRSPAGRHGRSGT